MNITRSILIGIPAVILLAGCHSATTPSSGGTSTAAPTGSTAGGASGGPVPCSSMPASFVESALGLSGLTASSPTSSSVASICQYTDMSSGTMVQVQTFINASASKMAQEKSILQKSGETVRPVSGVGDQAFVGTLGQASGITTENTFAALNGSFEVVITSPVSTTKEGALAAQVFSKAG